MTSRNDDKAVQVQGKSAQGESRNNVVTLIPKARMKKAGNTGVIKPSAPDRRTDQPVCDGDDDPGPTAA